MATSGDFLVATDTWRYAMESIPEGTRLTESFDAERPLSKAMTWITMKWTGSPDRDDDLRRGMETTLERIKGAAESR